MALDKSSSLKLFSSTIVFIFWHSFFSCFVFQRVFFLQKNILSDIQTILLFLLSCNKVTPTLPFSILLKCVCDIHSFLASTFCDIFIFNAQKLYSVSNFLKLFFHYQAPPKTNSNKHFAGKIIFLGWPFIKTRITAIILPFSGKKSRINMICFVTAEFTATNRAFHH